MSKSRFDLFRGSWKLTSKIFLLAFLWAFFCFANNADAYYDNDSLLGYWKFDGDFNDSSGHVNAVTAFNLAGYDTSLPPTTFLNSSSLTFTSLTGSHATFADQPNLQPNAQLTFSLWLRFDNSLPATTTQIAGNFAAGQNQGFFFRVSPDGKVSFVVQGNETSLSVTALSANQWYHLVGTWDHSQARLYIGGASEGSGTAAITPNYVSSNFQVGYFIGKMDDLRLYKRVLSSQEIIDLAAGHHTSAIWIGGTNPYYDIPANWSTGAVPDPYTLVTINPPVTYQPNFSSYPEEMAGLTINSGASLNLLGNNLTIHDGGTFSNDGTLSLYSSSSQILNNFVNDTDSGTVAIVNNSATINNLKTGFEYYNLIINGNTITTSAALAVSNDLTIGGGTLASGATLTINGDLNISGGNLVLGADLTINGNLNLPGGTLNVTTNTPARNINLAGNWNNTGGNFNAGNGTVYLSGNDQEIYGSNEFYNLAKSVSTSATLTFEADTTQTIFHNLSLQSTGLLSNFLALRSSSSGTRWNLYSIGTTGTINVSGLDIQDSYNHGSDITLTGRNKDSGNNIGWLFDTMPPEVALNSVVSLTKDNHQSVTGTATESSTFSTIVSLVEYQMDGISDGAWSDCVANVVPFDTASEAFICTPTTLADGLHTMYIRATDTNGNASTPITADFTVDTTAPSLSEKTPVTNPTGDASPDYTFHTSEAGSIMYGGDCSTGSSSAAIGDNTVNFNTLAEGAHTNCTIRVTDAVGNASTLLHVTSFTVDVTAPVLTQVTAVATPTNDATPDYIFNSNETGTITYGGSCSSATMNASAGNSTITFSALADGTYGNCTIRVTDAASNQSSILSIPSFIVAVPPAISSVSADESSSSATISWTTDEAATSMVDYGLSSAYGVSTTEADTTTLVANHRVALSGLSSCTTYHYRVRSKDTNSNEAVDLDNTFKTTGCTDSCSDGDPDKPDLDEAKALDSSSIKIYYKDSEEKVDRYELKYGTASGTYEWSVDDIGGKNEEDYVVKELKSGTTYYFRIRAVNDCGKSDWTTEVSASTDKESSTSIVAEQIPAAETTTPPAAAAVMPDTGNSLLKELPVASDSLSGQLQNPANFENAQDSSIAPSDNLSISTVEMIEGGAGKKIKIGGKGPPNTTLTVYVYSGDPIVIIVKTDSNGDWTYTMDKELEDGNHEVYVAVTNNTGAIKAKSEPLPFVKTAQAVTVVSPAESLASKRGIWDKGGIFIYIAVVFLGLFLALVLIGLYKRGISRKEELPGA